MANPDILLSTLQYVSSRKNIKSLTVTTQDADKTVKLTLLHQPTESPFGVKSFEAFTIRSDIFIVLGIAPNEENKSALWGYRLGDKGAVYLKNIHNKTHFYADFKSGPVNDERKNLLIAPDFIVDSFLAENSSIPRDQITVTNLLDKAINTVLKTNLFDQENNTEKFAFSFVKKMEIMK